MTTGRAEIAIRLIEERAKAGYSQADFARQLDISGETLRRYEMGLREMGAEFLARAASLGVDVQYILTGARSTNASEAERAAQPGHQSAHTASGNIAQFRDVTGTLNMIHTQQHVSRTTAKVSPGDEHISQQQAAVLTGLVKDIVRLEAQLKEKPKSIRAVWAALNANRKVTRYLLIPAADFPKAEKYLRQWIGRLNASASAPKTDNDGWRKRRYAYIKINTKDNESWLVGYLRDNFNVDSIALLGDEELETVYRTVASRKRKKGATLAAS
ncbi:helix-turn-helix domain-containing protein [Pandoraea apista]|uniref:helix-turn-helix domain-containing protein n=1 Tax=Pandoraea apista TaxID=93218 RepID=UPI000F672914|nr:helix-turn-helix transcriptional regulator [Pandoraea apista]RRW89176.1 XRE family transcriptional regulator [Pandoraea apista]RRW98970.1 XRE family transcriptional regulator [Pandoraea apista]